MFCLPGVVRSFVSALFQERVFEEDVFRVSRGVGRCDPELLRPVHGLGERSTSRGRREYISLQENTTGEETVELATPLPVSEPTPEPTQNTTTSPATGASGVVSSASPLATRAGLDILNEGGNAFDAAVVASLGVEPMMSGLGGYGAIVV